MDWSRRLRSKSAKKTELFCSGHAEFFTRPCSNQPAGWFASACFSTIWIDANQ